MISSTSARRGLRAASIVVVGVVTAFAYGMLMPCPVRADRSSPQTEAYQEKRFSQMQQEVAIMGEAPLPNNGRLPLSPSEMAQLLAAKPQSGNPGVVVCEPVAAPGVPADLAAFSRACGDWLDFVVGGDPRFGQSAPFEDLHRAEYEFNGRDYTLTFEMAAKLHSTCGAAVVAVGKIYGTPDKCRLSYNLYTLPSRKPIGTTLSVSGTPQAVIDALPGLAQAMESAVMAGSAQHIAPVGARYVDMVFLGRKRDTGEPGEAVLSDRQHLQSLASSTALGAMQYLSWPQIKSEVVVDQAVDYLAHQYPDNANVYYQIAGSRALAVSSLGATLAKLAAQYPHSFDLNAAQTLFFFNTGDFYAGIQWAKKAVTSAPNEPVSWDLLSNQLSNVYQSVQMSDYSTMLTPAQTEYASEVSAMSTAAERQAVHIDPLDGFSWFKLAGYAVFNGDPIARPAIYRAMALLPDEADTYEWGMQMFQEKWGGSKGDLDKVVSMAIAHQWQSESDVQGISAGLDDCGSRDSALTMIRSWIDDQKKALQQDPNDIPREEGLGDMYASILMFDDALAQYNAAAASGKDDLPPYNQIARCYFDKGDWADAEAAARKAVAQDPRSVYSLQWLVDILFKENKNQDAEPLLRSELKISPFDSDANFDMGGLLQQEGDYAQSVGYLKTAFQWARYRTTAGSGLAYSYHQLGDYALSLTYAKAALSHTTDNESSLNTAEDDLLHLKRYGDAYQLSALALTMNAKDNVSLENEAEADYGEGKIADAVTIWQTVVTADPTGPMGKAAAAFLQKNAK